eukprot:14177180-Alexandrium_andersonii.AAC.1
MNLEPTQPREHAQMRGGACTVKSRIGVDSRPTIRGLRPSIQKTTLFAKDRDAASTDCARDKGPTGHGKEAATDW